MLLISLLHYVFFEKLKVVLISSDSEIKKTVGGSHQEDMTAG